MLSDNLMEMTVLIFRATMVPLLIYNLLWSVRGFCSLLRGKNIPSAYYGSSVFLTCLPLLGFQITAFTDLEHVGNGPITLMFVLCFTLMNVVAIIGRRYSRITDKLTEEVEAQIIEKIIQRDD